MLAIEKALDQEDFKQAAQLIADNQGISEQERASLLNKIHDLNHEHFLKYQVGIRIYGELGYQAISEKAPDVRACYLALYDSGLDVSTLPRDIQTELLELALIDGDPERFKKITQAVGDDWQKIKINEVTLFQYAAMMSSPAILAFLYEKDQTQMEVPLELTGYPPENLLVQLNGSTPLLLSSGRKGKIENARWLIKNGANPLVNGHAYAFAKACVFRIPEIINDLSDEDPECFKGYLGYAMLETAISRDKKDIITQLVKLGASYVHPRNPNYSGIMETAIRQKNKDLIIDILDKHPELVEYHEEGTDLIGQAAYNRNPDLVRFFIERGAKIGSKTFRYPLDDASKKEMVLAGLDQHLFCTDPNDPLEYLDSFLNPFNDEEMILDLFNEHLEKMIPVLSGEVLLVVKGYYKDNELESSVAIQILADIPEWIVEHEFYGSKLLEMISSNQSIPELIQSCINEMKANPTMTDKVMMAISKISRFSMTTDEAQSAVDTIQQAQQDVGEAYDFSEICATFEKAHLKALAQDPVHFDEVIKMVGRGDISTEEGLAALGSVKSYDNYDYGDNKTAKLIHYLNAQKDSALLKMRGSDAQVIPRENWENIKREIKKYQKEETQLTEDISKLLNEAKEFIKESKELESSGKSLAYPDKLSESLAEKLQASGVKFEFDENEHIFRLTDVHMRKLEPPARVKPLKQTSKHFTVTMLGQYNKEKVLSFDELVSKIDEPFNELKTDLDALQYSYNISDDGKVLTVQYGDDQSLEFEIDFFKEGYILKQAEYHDDRHRPMFTDTTELKLYIQDVINYIGNPLDVDAIPGNDFESEYFQREQAEVIARANKNT